MQKIHPTAIVHPNARIGDLVEIGPFSVIEDDVDIGPGTVVGSYCFIHSGARIAKNVRIFHGSVVAGPPQDLKYAGEKTELFIGEDTVIREFCTLHRGTTYSYKTVLGGHCLLMAYSHVAHDCIIGDNVILANSVQLGGHSIIDDYAIIGGGALIHQFCRVGAHSIMSGGSATNKDIPPFVKAGHYPAQYVGVNTVGLRRRGFTPEAVHNIQDVYRAIYLSGMNVSQALEHVKGNFNMTPEVLLIIRFIEVSTRGILRGNRGVSSVE